MAQQVIQLALEKLSCSICLDLLKDPVTIPCGHSYCMSCIKSYWGEDDETKTRSCPQCRESISPRPVLVKNTMLAELVEELKNTGLPAASPDHFYAGPGDVACDLCAGRKLKASKSCLVCMASYCEQHLQPHYNLAPFRKHSLIQATLKLHENICPEHDEVMKIFCRTDQLCICYLCSMDDHKGHITVSAAAERAERQKELGVNRPKIQQRIQDMERDAKVLQQEIKAVKDSADKAVRDSKEVFTDLIELIEKKSSEVEQQIRSQQKTEDSRIKELLEKMEQEIAGLRRKDTELEQLSLTEDHLHFLKNYPSLCHPSDYEDFPRSNNSPLRYFEELAGAVTEAGDKLHALLNDECQKISLAVNKADVLLPQKEPKTREEFLKYSHHITMDPDTAHTYLSLSDGNRKATLTKTDKSLSSDPNRFGERWQVLCREALTGRCYWEVKLSGKIHVAVAYKDIGRKGTREECGFGYNGKSWSLECSNSCYTFRYNNISTVISGPRSSPVGVYLDHEAGTLSFYSISETMTLLHRVQTRFTQPLYPGFWLPYNAGDTVELCDLP
ncbi:tripartite motif-containing protein 16-like [Brachyistius frenatus]|uniref:tripartite motif-containing protein 16-like n=1 Tax=Brachyistius frenatus TaxID=100188 RepID=UPI0037E79736